MESDREKCVVRMVQARSSSHLPNSQEYFNIVLKSRSDNGNEKVLWENPSRGKGWNMQRSADEKLMGKAAARVWSHSSLTLKSFRLPLNLWITDYGCSIQRFFDHPPAKSEPGTTNQGCLMGRNDCKQPCTHRHTYTQSEAYWFITLATIIRRLPGFIL